MDIPVFNLSKPRQIIGKNTLLPGEWTDIPYDIAKNLAKKAEYRSESLELLNDFALIEGDQLHLGWSSPFHYADGYGSVAQEIASTFLEKLDIALSIYPRDYDPSHHRFGNFTLDDWEHGAYVPRNIVDQLRMPQPDCFYGFNMTWPRMVHEHMFPRGIGFTMFETTRPPLDWAHCMNQCRRIVTPCKQNKEAFQSIGVTVPIDVVGLGVNPEKWPFLNRREVEGPFTFLMAGGITHRKNPQGAVYAFLKAFPKNKDVRLVIKTRGNVTAAGFRSWMDDLPKDDRIVMICEETPPAGMVALMHSAHAFVFPSRAEGFGLPPMQAMCTGMPTIISDNSGMSEYCDVRYNYPIPCRPVPVPPNEKGGYPKDWGDVGEWWEPDEEYLVETMRNMVNFPDAAFCKGIAGSDWVSQKWTIERTCWGLLDVVAKDYGENQ